MFKFNNLVVVEVPAQAIIIAGAWEVRDAMDNIRLAENKNSFATRLAAYLRRQ
jgi:hypothetical protein